MCRFAPAPLAAEDDERATHLLKRRLHVVECDMVKGHVAYHYLVAIGDRGNQQQVALDDRGNQQRVAMLSARGERSRD